MIGYQSVKLKPGQFIFGRRSAAKATGLSEKVVRNCLKRLIKSEKATHQRAHHFSIITICNWDKYQCADIPKGPTKGPTRGPPGATDKNVKKGKKGKELLSKDSKLPPREKIKSLCKSLVESKVFPSAYVFQGWAFKKKKHPDAILQALDQCLYYKPKKPWGYCAKIVGIQSGNFYERDNMEHHEAIKEIEKRENELIEYARTLRAEGKTDKEIEYILGKYTKNLYDNLLKQDDYGKLIIRFDKEVEDGSQ